MKEPNFSLLEEDDRTLENKGCLTGRVTLKHWGLERRKILEKVWLIKAYRAKNVYFVLSLCFLL